MFEVHEITEKERLIRSCKSFKMPYTDGCRGFILIDEGKDVGLGIIALNKATVELVGVTVDSSYPKSYWDLLNRAVLNVVKNFGAPIKIHVDSEDDYYLNLGFKKCPNGGYEAMNFDVDLSGECKKH